MLSVFGFVLLVTVSPVKAGYVEGHYSLASMHKTCHSQTLVNLSQTGPLLIEFDSSKMPVKYLKCSLTILPPSGLTAFLKHARLGYSRGCSDEFVKLSVGKTGSEAICGEVASGSGNFANASRSDFSPWRLFATSTSRTLTIIYQRKRVLQGNTPSSFRIAVTPMGQNCSPDSGYIPCGESGYCVPAAVACDGFVNCVGPGSGFAHDESLDECNNIGAHTISLKDFKKDNFVRSFSAVFPWAAVIITVIGLSIISILGVIYSIKSGYGCSSWYKDAVDAAKRTELVVAHPNQIGANDGFIGGGEKMVTFGNGRRKPPLVSVPADVGGYLRTDSKESTETLLSDPKRNASGNSESTSGCESARSSEIGNDDEMEGEADHEATTLNAATAAHFPGTASGYVVAHRGMTETAAPTVCDGPDTFWSPGAAGVQTGLPPGYSRMSQAFDPPGAYGMPTTQESRGYVAFAAAPKHQPPPPSQRGYVTFGSAQSGFPQSPDKPPSFPPPGKGYITMAEAAKMESFNPAATASERLPEHEPSLSAIGYSKLGMSAAPVSGGYVSHDELLGKQQLSDRLRQV